MDTATPSIQTVPTVASEVQVSLISKDISYIQRDISEIKQSVKELGGVYSTQVYVDDANRTMGKRIETLERSSNLWRWLSPTLAAILGSVLTFLLQQYLLNLGR